MKSLTKCRKKELYTIKFNSDLADNENISGMAFQHSTHFPCLLGLHLRALYINPIALNSLVILYSAH